MKILFISNISSGVNSFSIASVMAAKELGIEFHMAANFSGTETSLLKENEKKYGVTLHQIDFIRAPYDLRNIRAYKQVVSLIKKEKFDAIHCNTPIGGVIGRIAGKKCGIKRIIYQAHGFHFFKGAPKKNWIMYYPIERMLAHFTDAIIAINKEDYKQAKKIKLRKKGQVYYVPGVGIDIKEYQIIDKQRERKRDELGIPNDALVIISVGELNKNKNNSVIISALGIINDPHIHYILCGVGEEKEQMQSLTHKLGLDNNVHFLGYRTDVKELYKASDIFVMPSFREGLSRSIMEAMASGLPCIVSRIRGNVDLVKNGIGGFLCDPYSPEEFAEAINMCDNDTRKKMHEYNLNSIKKYDIHSVEKEIRNIYKDEFGQE